VITLLSMMSHGGAPLLKELGFDMEQIGMGYHQSLSALFLQGQKEGLLPAGIDPNVLVMYFFAFFNGAGLHPWAAGHGLAAGRAVRNSIPSAGC
jgi:hypothetical protein